MTTITASELVRFIRDGVIPYMRGEWDPTIADYSWAKEFRDIVTYDGLYYAIKTPGKTAPKGISPFDDVRQGKGYWEASKPYKMVVTDLLIAAYAILSGAVCVDGYMISQTGTLAGKPSTEYKKFKRGDPAGFQPDIVIDFQRGKIICGDAEIEGTIKALKGLIGRIKIDESGLCSDNMRLTDEMISFKDGENRKIEFGTPSILGMEYMGRIENKSFSQGTNAGVLLNITGAAYNLAFAGNGSLVSDDLVTGCGYFLYASTSSNKIIGDTSLRKSNNILVRFLYDNCGVALPTVSDVQQSFGRAMSSTKAFCVNVRVVCTGDSTKNGWVYGRTTELPFLNNSQYPYLRDNNYGNTAKLEMGRGDILEYLLVFNGAIYDAYLLNNRQ